MGLFGDKWDNIVSKNGMYTYVFGKNEEKEANIACGKIYRHEHVQEYEKEKNVNNKWSFDIKNNTLILKSEDALTLKDIKDMFKAMVS